MPTIFRARFLLLPFQNYLASYAKNLPITLGIGKKIGKDQLGLFFDEEGNLWIDQTEMRTISKTLSNEIDEEFSKRLLDRFEGVVKRLQVASKEAYSIEEDTNINDCLRFLQSWVNALIEYVPFLHITKILPDTVLHILMRDEAGFIEKYRDEANIILSPQSSQSLEFFKSSLQLYIESLENGCEVGRHKIVAPNRKVMMKPLKEFKQRWGGMGPRRWDLPGYESTSYIFESLSRFFSNLTLQQAKSKLVDIDNMFITNRDDWHNALELFKSKSRNYDKAMQLLSFLWNLQDVLESENRIFRQSFYFGAVTTIARIAKLLGEEGEVSNPIDVLFLHHDEIMDRRAKELASQIARRKNIYFRILSENKEQNTLVQMEKIINGDFRR